VNEGLDRTQELPPGQATSEEPTDQLPKRYRPGVAVVPLTHAPTVPMAPELPTGQIVTSGHLKQPKLPLRHRLRNLRSGGRWSLVGAGVLVVCWTLWAAQTASGGYANEALILFLILAVALGLFGVLRLAGGIVLERLLKRTRRSAVLSHLAIGVLLAAAGISLLPRVEWLINAWNDIRGMR
jgi:hypothetical protein